MKELNKKVLKLYKDGVTPEWIAEGLNLHRSRVYRILKKMGISFKPEPQNPMTKGEVVQDRVNNRRKELNITLQGSKSKGIKQVMKPLDTKTLKIFKDPEKYEREINRGAREKIVLILNEITPERIKMEKFLSPLVNALPVLLDIAEGKRKFKKLFKDGININQLQMNIVTGIEQIKKFNAPLAKELGDKLKSMEKDIKKKYEKKEEENAKSG